MKMSKKMTLKGKFVDKPQDYVFSNGRTRRAITSVLLEMTKDEKPKEVQIDQAKEAMKEELTKELKLIPKNKNTPILDNKDRLFGEVFNFDVTKEGEFTVELKVQKEFGGNDGIKKEKIVCDILEALDRKFGIGSTKDLTIEEKNIIENMVQTGVLSIGFIMGLKDDEAK